MTGITAERDEYGSLHAEELAGIDCRQTPGNPLAGGSPGVKLLALGRGGDFFQGLADPQNVVDAIADAETGADHAVHRLAAARQDLAADGGDLRRGKAQEPRDVGELAEMPVPHADAELVAQPRGKQGMRMPLSVKLKIAHLRRAE